MEPSADEWIIWMARRVREKFAKNRWFFGPVRDQSSSGVLMDIELSKYH